MGHRFHKKGRAVKSVAGSAKAAISVLMREAPGEGTDRDINSMSIMEQEAAYQDVPGVSLLLDVPLAEPVALPFAIDADRAIGCHLSHSAR